MIDIRISKKKKSNGGSSRRTSSTVTVNRSTTADYAFKAGYADEAGHAVTADIALKADEAAHAINADNAINADEATHALSADNALNADEAEHALTADKATNADNALLWNGNDFSDWLTQPLREGDTVTFAEVITSILRSPNFVSGLLGEGFSIEADGQTTKLTVDQITVRQAMVVMEMLTERVRSIGGTLVVSAADGRISEVADGGDNWLLTFETDHTFMVGDYLRCAKGVRSWWAEAVAVDGKRVSVRKPECECVPAVGDEPVLLGSKITNRQNAILISASGDGEPRMDVLSGINDKNLDGCLRARFGELGGIVDLALNPQGVGLFSDNAYLRGEFVLSTGENILTRFAITEGKIMSEVRNARIEGAVESCLNNGQFMDGADYWVLSPGSAPLIAKGKWLSSLGRFLAVPKKRSSWIADGVLWLNNGSALQTSMHYRPDVNTTVRIHVTVEPITTGTLCVRLGNAFSKQWQLHIGSLKRYEAECKWDGLGNFSVAYTGKCRITVCAVTPDAAATLQDRYATLFEQSEKLIRLSAMNFADDGTVLSESSIAQTAEGISAKVSENIEGALRQTGIDIRTGEVTVSADKISFTDSIGNEQALIKDGRVNAAAVDVKEVVVRDAMNPQKRVEIKPTDGDIVIHDADGRECQRLTGDNCEDAAAYYFGTDGAGSVNIVFPTVTGSKTYGNVDGETREVVFPLSNVWSNHNINEVLWKLGSLTLSARCEDFYVPYEGENEFHSVRLRGVDGTATFVVQGFSDEATTNLVGEWSIASLACAASLVCEDEGDTSSQIPGMLHYIGDNNMVNADLTGASVKTTKGQYFRIAVRLAYTAKYAGCYMEIGWHSLQAESITEAYASHFFANGFALGTSSKNFVTVWNAEGGMQLLARNGDAGMRFDSQGLQVLKNGTWIKL